METNQPRGNQQQVTSDNTTSNQTDQSAKKVGEHTPQDASEEFMGDTVENPASQSEAGPDIYDIGMGGPGASSSGLRDTDKEQSDEG
jgi:hypothetical protein